MSEPTIQQFQLRLPFDLKEDIEKEATKSNRSLHAQILFMLQSFEESKGRLSFLPNDLQMRLEKYQIDNNMPITKTIKKLLNEALQNRDTIDDILDQLDAAFEKEKDLRILARDILSTHILVTNINIDDNTLSFRLKNGSKGEIDRKGNLSKNDDIDNYNDNMESYVPPQKRPKKKQSKSDWDTSKTPNNDLDDEIPF